MLRHGIITSDKKPVGIDINDMLHVMNTPPYLSTVYILV